MLNLPNPNRNPHLEALTADVHFIYQGLNANQGLGSCISGCYPESRQSQTSSPPAAQSFID